MKVLKVIMVHPLSPCPKSTAFVSSASCANVDHTLGRGEREEEEKVTAEEEEEEKEKEEEEGGVCWWLSLLFICVRVFRVCVFKLPLPFPLNFNSMRLGGSLPPFSPVSSFSHPLCLPPFLEEGEK